MKRLCFTALLVALLASAACDDSDSERVPQASDKRPIADVLSGFFEAAGNGRSTDLAPFWSDTCSEEERRQEAQTVRDVWVDVGTVVLGGEEYRFTVDADGLVVEQVDSDEAAVPLSQPKGVFTTTAGGFPLPFEADRSISLRREDGGWKVASCRFFTEGA